MVSGDWLMAAAPCQKQPLDELDEKANNEEVQLKLSGKEMECGEFDFKNLLTRSSEGMRSEILKQLIT